ncbi:hypothetical protein ACT3CE_09845 [Marinifilum sp. RC60d5]|uniref:hypothetical protein n=1 Tax=Marinifilum sp. RC60d5 TaxID=3458414 RepID=UPI00403749F5
MKQPLKNIISLILLAFYLTGFCGIHFVKHSCFSCNHSEIQLNIGCDYLSDSNEHDCCCESHNHTHDSKESLCSCENCFSCDYDFIYLKTNPTTTLTENSKAPIALEINLFQTYSSNLELIITPKIAKYDFEYPCTYSYKEVFRENICCFIC